MPQRSYTRVLDQPAPGTDWSFIPSTSDWYRLLSITAQLTSSVTTGERYPGVTVTDETGNLVTADPNVDSQPPSESYLYSWRPGNIYYADAGPQTVNTSSIPGFWLPSGSTVAAKTTGLDPPAPAVQASADTGDQSALLPVIIVAATNDKFNWTGAAGGGTPTDFTIAPGTYTTIAQVATALNAALAGAVAFHTQALVTVDGGTNGYLFTAVADIGADGNGDVVQSAGSHDAWATITGASGSQTLMTGVDADGGDQWTAIVATFVVADEEHWRSLEALIGQVLPGG